MSSSDLPKYNRPVEMVCSICNHKGKYNKVGTFLMGDGQGLDSVGFTGCVRCRHCNSGGPWSFQGTQTPMLLSALLLARVAGEPDVPLSMGSMGTFDGRKFQFGGLAEDHLLSLLTHEPERANLWARLGNFYVHHEMWAEAYPAFEKSTQLDAADIEVWHSLGVVALRIKRKKQAIHALQQVLARQHNAKNVRPDMFRLVTTDARLTLEDLGAPCQANGSPEPGVGGRDLKVGRPRGKSPHTFIASSRGVTSEQ